MIRVSITAFVAVLLIGGVQPSPASAQESAFPGSWELPGSNMRMKIGGYVKADFIYDVDGTRDPSQFLMSTIPVPGEPDFDDGGYLYFMAKETRFNIDVRRVEEGAAPLRMFLEGDFFSTGNQFRLRHAYMIAGDFVIGQNWTTLSVLEALPIMIDFAAGDALFGGRTTQVRWQKATSDHLRLAVGVEMLPTTGIDNPGSLAGKAKVQLPLLAVRADYAWSSGTLYVGSSVAQLNWDGGTSGPSATAVQFDGLVALRQRLGGRTTVTAHVSAGIGSGENVMAFAGSRSNAVLQPDGTLETMPALAFVGGLIHGWNDELTTNASLAYGWLDAPDTRDPFALKHGGIAHVNLVWRPMREFGAGIEYMWGGQKASNDALGHASRIQAMTAFYF